jgi:hypothetical protein
MAAFLSNSLPLKNTDDTANVQCVMKNGMPQSVGTIMAPFVSSDIGNSICPSR